MNTKWERGFKVGITTSYGCASCHAPISIRCEYGEDRVTTPLPGHGPLAVFRRLADARKFVDICGFKGVGIWECRYIRSGRRMYRPSGGPLALWKRAGDEVDGAPMYRLSSGTVTAAAVELVRFLE